MTTRGCADMSRHRRRRRGLVRDVEDLLVDLGVEDYELCVTGGGHYRVTVRVGDLTSKYFFPSTPGDKRTKLNTLAGVRRTVCRLRVT